MPQDARQGRLAPDGRRELGQAIQQTTVVLVELQNRGDAIQAGAGQIWLHSLRAVGSIELRPDVARMWAIFKRGLEQVPEVLEDYTFAGTTEEARKEILAEAGYVPKLFRG